MKATGIVRRIDELGRIVVPKEIRKNLRINEGENLEIFVDDEDNIVLKRYSLVKKLEELSKVISESIYYYTKNVVLVFDSKEIIAVSGLSKKEYLNKEISNYLESMILKRENTISKSIETMEITDDKTLKVSYAICPIILSGDCIGSIIILNEKNEITDADYKIIQIASKILCTSLE